jgi:hypothetical protein
VTVQLEAPLTRSPWSNNGWTPDEALKTAPRYMRHDTMSYWHRPRSGIRRGRDGFASYQLWCGSLAFESRILLTADRPPEGEQVCATCEGRAIGAGQDVWPVPDGPNLAFAPRRLTPPRKCPGSRSERLYEEVGRSVVRCLACDELVRGWFSSWRYGPVNHPPGPGLVPGCEFHAWSYLTVHDGKAICTCKALRTGAADTKGDTIT